MTTRIARITIAAAVALAAFAAVYLRRYPAETTPEGAYLRLAKHVELGEPELVFSYLEGAARDAVYTTARARTDALEKVRASFPKEEARSFAEAFAPLATADDGPKAFARFVVPRGWMGTLAKELAPIERVETEGDRSTVVTRKGTRFPFRRDRDGRYGLTSFTRELVAQATQAERDLEMIRRNAADYERRRGGSRSAMP